LWFLRLTIAGCLAAGLVPPPASAAPSWSRPANVSRPEKVVVESLSVIAGSQGSATAVWQLYGGESGIVKSAVRRAGGSWSAPFRLFDDVSDIYASQIAVDPAGNTTAVWERHEGHSFVVQSATRPAGGNWSAPVNLSKLGRFARDAQIAVDPQGDATAIWARSNGRNLVVQGAMRPAGGSWSAPVDISAHHGQGGFYPRLVMDSWGNATAVWKGYDRNRHNLAIQAATRPLGGGWSPPTDVSNRLTRHIGISEPQIAVDPQGISTVTWVIGARGGGIIQAATSARR